MVAFHSYNFNDIYSTVEWSPINRTSIIMKDFPEKILCCWSGSTSTLKSKVNRNQPEIEPKSNHETNHKSNHETNRTEPGSKRIFIFDSHLLFFTFRFSLLIFYFSILTFCFLHFDSHFQKQKVWIEKWTTISENRKVKNIKQKQKVRIEKYKIESENRKVKNKKWESRSKKQNMRIEK